MTDHASPPVPAVSDVPPAPAAGGVPEPVYLRLEDWVTDHFIPDLPPHPRR